MCCSRRRQASICSEEGSKSRLVGNGSFKTAGNCCAKLKRHNACRQKNREVTSAHCDSKTNEENENVSTS